MTEQYKVPGWQDRILQDDGRLHGVIVGCRRADGRWLLIRRSANVLAPNKVSFPGGGIDHQETQAETAIREMQEELSAKIRPVACVWHSESQDKPLTLWGWYAELLNSNLVAKPSEVAEILWLLPDEIRHHPDIMPDTDKFLKSLLDQAE